eukprot:10332430-Lingulodinium_polyedra.AAC.1
MRLGKSPSCAGSVASRSGICGMARAKGCAGQPAPGARFHPNCARRLSHVQACPWLSTPRRRRAAPSRASSERR